jgi:hypothetical protein
LELHYPLCWLVSIHVLPLMRFSDCQHLPFYGHLVKVQGRSPTFTATLLRWRTVEVLALLLIYFGEGISSQL